MHALRIIQRMNLRGPGPRWALSPEAASVSCCLLKEARRKRSEEGSPEEEDLKMETQEKEHKRKPQEKGTEAAAQRGVREDGNPKEQKQNRNPEEGGTKIESQTRRDENKGSMRESEIIIPTEKEPLGLYKESKGRGIFATFGTFI